MDIKYINSIIQKSVNQQLSSEEERILAHWTISNNENKEYYAKVKAIYILEKLKTINVADDNKLFSQQLTEKISRDRLKRNLIKYSAAAVVLLIVVLGAYFIKTNNEVKEPILAKVINIQPGLVIKRNNIIVDLLSESTNKSEHKIDPNKKEIDLRKIDSLENAEVIISIERGYQYCVTLPDSTRVWLNSESELRYNDFSSEQREVLLKGEACFDVVKDKSRPFIVKLSNERSVTVLGTFFSVKAYEGDDDTKISLVEGSVNVKNGNENLMLTPNEEVVIDNQSNKARIQNFDRSRIMACITGNVIYYNEELEDIVKDLSRRYDKELIIEDSIVGKERLTIILDGIKFEDLINYIKKTGKGLFNVIQEDNKVVFRKKN